MTTYPVPMRLRTLGVVSILLGLLGAIFYWWTPLGMVVSLAGLILGISGAIMARGGQARMELLLCGIVVSLLALALNLVIACLGLEVITFTALR